jgi:C_GCAxxG_C_C family probable redox protein
MTEQAAQRSRELFESGYYCAESVLLAIAEHQNIESDVLPQIATGFCSGMSRLCSQCGAVSGAIMGLGLIMGRHTPAESIEPTYVAVQKLVRQFEEKHGSINCFQLLDIDVSTPEGREEFQSSGAFAKCLDYVEEATRLALMLAESRAWR